MKNHILVEFQRQLEIVENAKYEELFERVAVDILNNYGLKIGDVIVELCEIEFYYFCCTNHPDTYIHLDKLQQEIGRLYVHKKGYTRGGIDITFGNGKFFGGILIRGIKIKGENPIYGPALSRQRITRLLNLVENINYKKLQEEVDKLNIELVTTNYSQDQIKSYRRYGLNESKDKEFHDKKYRFKKIK